MPFARTSLESDRAVVADVESHAALLATAGVSLIAMNCMAASMAVGAQGINQRIFGATGIRSVTTTDAILAALHAVGAGRVALMTPYPREVVEMEIAFLARHGVEVACEIADPCSTPIQQGSFPASHWVDLAQQLDTDNADAILISCAGIQISDVIEDDRACRQTRHHQQPGPALALLARARPGGSSPGIRQPAGGQFRQGSIGIAPLKR